MPLDPDDDAHRPARLILPGEEHAPSTGSRIVLPPGVSRDTPDDLPEYPRLRPLVLMPFSDGQRELLLVNDPLGVIEGQPVLGIEALSILQLLDGTVSLADITTALMRESKDLRVANMLREFIAQMDRLLMLEGPRFEEAFRERRGEYHQLEIRPAALEGRSYPAEPAELTEFLGAQVAEAESWRELAGEAKPADGTRPRALMAPHLDPRRAGPAIARAYLEIGPGSREPLRVVVLGTGHSLIDDKLALTRKHFETPLGRVTCDTAFVGKVADHLGAAAYHGELAHREEHSIEFQALYLKYMLGDRPFTIVPILCGGFHSLLDDRRSPREEPVVESLIAGVREAQAALGGDTLFVAGVDFSHMGPRFGDAAIDEATKHEIEGRDREAIAAAETGDADAWYQAIASHDDSTRICGFAPTYVMLRCIEPGPGHLLRYEQSDEPDTSVVSIASMVWP